MFERFTDRARRVLVLAQEESHSLGHTFIGTEHIAWGLAAESLGDGEGVASRVLASMKIDADSIDQKIQETVGTGDIGKVLGQPPFTPRAKKVLELALREALQIGHSYISTEHILLGLVREGDGVGIQILNSLGATNERLRSATMGVIGSQPSSLPPEKPITPIKSSVPGVECAQSLALLVDAKIITVDEARDLIGLSPKGVSGE